MPRVTKSLSAKAKHKKILSTTKGHYGARSRLFKTAKQSNIKSLQYAFRDRKNRKRNFRSLWVARINAASRNMDISYSVLINSLNKKNIILNRKILSEIAVSDNNADEVVEAISTSANSYKIGDGKIFIVDLNQLIRIRTGDLNEDAL